MGLCKATHVARYADGKATKAGFGWVFLIHGCICKARAGAISRKSIVQTSEVPFGADGGKRTTINPPPPIPDLWDKHDVEI